MACCRRAVTIAHVNIPVGDLERSRRFYETALRPLGYGVGYVGDDSVGLEIDGREPIALRLGPAPNRGTHVAFAAESADDVDEFYAAALEAGGRDNGPPGERPYGGYYYAAFVLDPDGHNIEALFRG